MTNVILRGPIFSQSGYGSHSRDIALSLFNSQKFNISVIPTQWGVSSNSVDSIKESDREKLIFMANNRIHNNVPFIFIHIGIPTEFQKIGKYNVGITAGLEANKIPKNWVDKCNEIDLIIVPSLFEKTIFQESGVTSRVEVVEEGVDTTIYNNNPIDTNHKFFKELTEKIPTDINLLSTGQWLPGGVGEDRKGIGLLINTFLKTFEGNKKVGLILKTHINNNSSLDYYNTKEKIKTLKGNIKYPTITLIHGNLSDEEMSILYKHPKVAGYVSLTSGEGWGRGIAEAIASDLPILVTGWGGHMHFCNSVYAHTVEYNLKNVSKGALSTGFFMPDMVWAYPDAKDASNKMKYIVENVEKCKQDAKEFGEIFRQRFSKDVTYNRLIELLSEVRIDNNILTTEIM